MYYPGIIRSSKIQLGSFFTIDNTAAAMVIKPPSPIKTLHPPKLATFTMESATNAAPSTISIEAIKTKNQFLGFVVTFLFFIFQA